MYPLPLTRLNTLTEDDDSDFEDDDDTKNHQVDVEQVVFSSDGAEAAKATDQHEEDSENDQTGTSRCDRHSGRGWGLVITVYR